MFDPFELSQEQTAMVMTGANAVAPQWRERYLALVADELLACGRRRVTDDEVNRAIASVCGAFAEGMISDDE